MESSEDKPRFHTGFEKREQLSDDTAKLDAYLRLKEPWRYESE